MSGSTVGCVQGSVAMYCGESGLWSFGFPSLGNNINEGRKLAFSQQEIWLSILCRSHASSVEKQINYQHHKRATRPVVTTLVTQECLSCHVALHNLDLTLQTTGQQTFQNSNQREEVPGQEQR